MTKNELSSYQKDVIRRYYDNLSPIMLTRLEELVSELYLAGDDRKRERLWQKVEKSMRKLGVKAGIIGHIMQQCDVEILARNLQDWLKAARRGRRA